MLFLGKLCVFLVVLVIGAFITSAIDVLIGYDNHGINGGVQIVHNTFYILLGGVLFITIKKLDLYSSVSNDAAETEEKKEEP